MNLLWAGILIAAATVADAQPLEFPSNASLQLSTTNALDSYGMPLDVWDGGAMPTQTVEGHLTRQAWRIEATTLTTLQILRPLREQLRNDGYGIIFECQTEACGGFDFRFAVETLPPPAMQINIGDFRYLAASRDTDEGPDVIGLFVSRTTQAGFVQVTHVTPVPQIAVEATPLSPSSEPEIQPAPAVQTGLATQLDTTGHAVLRDLTFDTGSSQLGPGEFSSLQALADYLVAYPNRNVTLVGHTDSEGSLDGNIALSKRRAGLVLERLVTDYDVDRRRLEAEGMGYLSPVASNLTEQGREANRRVEVIVTSTQE